MASFFLSLQKFCLIAILVLGMTSCGGQGGTTNNVVPPPPSVPTNDISTRIYPDSVSSIQIGVDYNLQIYVPRGYQTSKAYPIIYAMDGDLNFKTMIDVLEGRGDQVIFVGIGRADRRTRDYNLSGSVDYYKFLTLDLIPYIEHKYKVVPEKRTLFGISFGGLMVGFAFFYDRNGQKYFSNYIAQEATFNIDQSTITAFDNLEKQLFESSKGSIPATLLLSGATCCYYNTNRDMYNKLLARNYQGFTLSLKEYHTDHGGLLVDSFTDSLRVLFP